MVFSGTYVRTTESRVPTTRTIRERRKRMTSDIQKARALEKKIDAAYHNSAIAEKRCAELSEKLFLAQKHWFYTKKDFPTKEHFKNEYSAFVYCAFSNGTTTWGDYSKVDFLSKSFDKESYDADNKKLVWCYAWMYLPHIPEEFIITAST